MLLYFFMCDNLSISLILRKKILNLSKNVSIPGVDEEKPKEGGGGGGGGSCHMLWGYVKIFYTGAQKNIFWFLSDFVSLHLLLNNKKHFCSVFTGIMEYL